MKKKRNRQALPVISPTHWKKVIMTLFPCLQRPVARIVWWDYFSMRNVSERWPHLDKLIYVSHGEEIPDITTTEMRTALIKIGYTLEKATIRIK